MKKNKKKQTLHKGKKVFRQSLPASGEETLNHSKYNFPHRDFEQNPTTRWLSAGPLAFSWVLRVYHIQFVSTSPGFDTDVTRTYDSWNHEHFGRERLTVPQLGTFAL